MKKLLSAAFIFLFGLNTYSYAAPKHPTMILVHGALLTSSAWAKVQSALQNKEYNVVTVDTPGRTGDGVAPNEATLSAAAAKVCKVAKLQHGQVMLVGHSQAGAIITQATAVCREKIAGLVYVAAVAPASGEKAFDLLSEQDNLNFDLAAPIDFNKGVSIPNLNSPIKNLFIGMDVSDEDATLAVMNMVPEPIVLADESLRYDENFFKRIPKFYISTTKDQIISPATQNKYIHRLYLTSVYKIETGHSPFVTQPAQLANILMQINDRLS